MLPYSPLHHILLADFAAAAGDPAIALVMTSGNVSDEPIAYRDEDALARLAPIADAFVLHDRPIHVRTDDSVVRAIGARPERPLLLRRSRGYVPASLSLPVAASEGVLACGAEQKNTFCVAKGARAWVSHHIGDLKNYETLASFREGVEHFERLFAVQPVLVAHDLHPAYLSSAYAVEREGVRLLAVQHHHAHLAACLAEHGEAGPAVGAIYDGTGLGLDGAVWGGELLVGGLHGFERAGHLLPVPLPGGDQAVREPWRMACAWLQAAGGGAGVPELPRGLAGAVDARRWDAVARMAERGLSSPATTSVGRLFDAVAALCGLRPSVTYEGQAAVELEGTVDADAAEAYEIGLIPDAAGALQIDPRAAILAIARDVQRGVARGTVAGRFHRGLAHATTRACAQIAGDRGLDAVVLSGGVFANRLLLEQCIAGLTEAGLRVLVPERLPPGDGGIAYGQAAIAAAAAA
jgi:hydrogenase maturation protein HypF